MITGEDVQRHETIVAVIGVKEAAQLVAVQRIVGGVEIEHDPRRRRWLLSDVHLDQVIFDAAHGGDDLLVPAVSVGADGGQFEAVQRALARQGFAAIGFPHPRFAERIGLADEHGQQRIVPQLIMIVEVFVPQAQAKHPLLE